ncbi:hypothetical protein F511_06595 [Dorcoceras hygrometricum]|uniref:Uncharacterized protein n=1 Tax=Dorcoceras hygrometricum TaxID=472368 RepID=A0A2Z7B503_9LAMI|nr:hypothetical protein F511_06595 [Dorcoceras hygrometricum]
MQWSMRKRHVLVTIRGINSKRNQQQEFLTHLLIYIPAGFLMYRLGIDDLVVASAEEQENDIRTATEEDQQQFRNLFIVIQFRSGGSISCLNTQHDT